MNLDASGWNVVLVGRWNKAIFTPDWIAKHLFDLESGEMVRVEVALDEFLPHRVTLQDVTVIVPTGRLILEPCRALYETLQTARTLATRALRALPETPVAAAGCNVRYRGESLSDATLAHLSLKLDNLLSDGGYVIEGRTVKRTILFRKQVINLSVTTTVNEPVEVEFNFHRASSTSKDLATWLSGPIDEIRETVSKLASEVLDLDIASGEAQTDAQDK